jgi:hypothetical protein
MPVQVGFEEFFKRVGIFKEICVPSGKYVKNF